MLKAKAIADLSVLLYSYLPASGFQSAAGACGVAEFWQEKSKGPAIQHLLEQTVEHRESKFCSLIERIVQRGLTYRERQGNPITRAEIEAINNAVARIGFKIPSLWDPEFHRTFSTPPSTTKSPATHEVSPTSARPQLLAALAALQSSFDEISQDKNRQRAGYSFEKLLGKLFEISSIRLDRPFRVEGEQIDGAFELDGLPYLLEAKWTAEPIENDQLYPFLEKVRGKSDLTRGLLISVNGFTPELRKALAHGKSLRLVLMDGSHLFRVFTGAKPLDQLLRDLSRALGTHGQSYTTVSEIFGDQGLIP